MQMTQKSKGPQKDVELKVVSLLLWLVSYLKKQQSFLFILPVQFVNPSEYRRPISFPI